MLRWGLDATLLGLRWRLDPTLLGLSRRLDTMLLRLGRRIWRLVAWGALWGGGTRRLCRLRSGRAFFLPRLIGLRLLRLREKFGRSRRALRMPASQADR